MTNKQPPPKLKTKVIIRRDKWRTGGVQKNATGHGYTHLRNRQGYYCCLGFIAETLGLENDELLGGMPNGTYLEPESGLVTAWDEDEQRDFGNKGFNYANTYLSEQAAAINDDPTTTPLGKEIRLLELFEDSPYELVFIGATTPYISAKELREETT